MGIVNHKYEAVNYRLEVRIDGAKNSEVEGFVLEHEEKWEDEVSFTPKVVGENQKVEFFLFKDGEPQPYLRSLHLWVNVTE